MAGRGMEPPADGRDGATFRTGGGAWAEDDKAADAPPPASRAHQAASGAPKTATDPAHPAERARGGGSPEGAADRLSDGSSRRRHRRRHGRRREAESGSGSAEVRAVGGARMAAESGDSGTASGSGARTGGAGEGRAKQGGGRGPVASGFAFQERVGRIDMRAVARVDLHEVVEGVDVDTLQAHLRNITFGRLEQADLQYYSDENILKLFHLSQLTIEYLINVQNALNRQSIHLRTKVDEVAKEVARQQASAAKREEDVKAMKRELRARKRTIRAYETLLMSVRPSEPDPSVNASETPEAKALAEAKKMHEKLAKERMRNVEEAREREAELAREAEERHRIEIRAIEAERNAERDAAAADLERQRRDAQLSLQAATEKHTLEMRQALQEMRKDMERQMTDERRALMDRESRMQRLQEEQNKRSVEVQEHIVRLESALRGGTSVSISDRVGSRDSSAAASGPPREDVTEVHAIDRAGRPEDERERTATAAIEAANASIRAEREAAQQRAKAAEEQLQKMAAEMAALKSDFATVQAEARAAETSKEEALEKAAAEREAARKAEEDREQAVTEQLELSAKLEAARAAQQLARAAVEAVSPRRPRRSSHEDDAPRREADSAADATEASAEPETEDSGAQRGAATERSSSGALAAVEAAAPAEAEGRGGAGSEDAAAEDAADDAVVDARAPGGPSARRDSSPVSHDDDAVVGQSSSGDAAEGAADAPAGDTSPDEAGRASSPHGEAPDPDGARDGVSPEPSAETKRTDDAEQSGPAEPANEESAPARGDDADGPEKPRSREVGKIKIPPAGVDDEDEKDEGDHDSGTEDQGDGEAEGGHPRKRTPRLRRFSRMMGNAIGKVFSRKKKDEKAGAAKAGGQAAGQSAGEGVGADAGAGGSVAAASGAEAGKASGKGGKPKPSARGTSADGASGVAPQENDDADTSRVNNRSAKLDPPRINSQASAAQRPFGRGRSRSRSYSHSRSRSYSGSAGSRSRSRSYSRSTSRSHSGSRSRSRSASHHSHGTASRSPAAERNDRVSPPRQEAPRRQRDDLQTTADTIDTAVTDVSVDPPRHGRGDLHRTADTIDTAVTDVSVSPPRQDPPRRRRDDLHVTADTIDTADTDLSTVSRDADRLADEYEQGARDRTSRTPRGHPEQSDDEPSLDSEDIVDELDDLGHDDSVVAAVRPRRERTSNVFEGDTGDDEEDGSGSARPPRADNGAVDSRDGARMGWGGSATRDERQRQFGGTGSSAVTAFTADSLESNDAGRPRSPDVDALLEEVSNFGSTDGSRRVEGAGADEARGDARPAARSRDPPSSNFDDSLLDDVEELTL